MQFKPDWRKIILIAVLINCAIIFAVCLAFPTPKKIAEENLLEIEWVEQAEKVAEPQAEVEEVAETFQPIILPPIEVPQSAAVEVPQPELPPEKILPEKPSEDTGNKIVVLVKVFPKDVANQLIAAGVLRERPTLHSDKIVIEISVGFDGKMKSVEILSGGEGGMINVIAEAAASGWVFAPYVDAEGNPQEIKTQIEFKPEDF